MKTLAYDCGNPVQYVCGHSPAVLFYLLDRHAPLAMTKGTKWIIPYSLTTPPQPPTKIAFSWGPVLGHPSNGGELSMFPSRSKLPFTTDGDYYSHPVAEQSSPLWRGGTKCRGGLSSEASAKGKTQVTSNSTAVITKEYAQR